MHGREFIYNDNKKLKRNRIFWGTLNGEKVVIKKIHHPDLAKALTNPLHPETQKLYPDYFKGSYAEPAPDRDFPDGGYACYIYKNYGQDLFAIRDTLDRDYPKNITSRPNASIMLQLYALALGVLDITIRQQDHGLVNHDIKPENFAASEGRTTAEGKKTWVVQPVDLENDSVAPTGQQRYLRTKGYFRFRSDSAAQKTRYALAVTIYALAFWKDAQDKLKDIAQYDTAPKRKLDKFFTPPEEASVNAGHHYYPFLECARHLANTDDTLQTCRTFLNHHHVACQRGKSPADAGPAGAGGPGGPPGGTPSSKTILSTASTTTVYGTMIELPPMTPEKHSRCCAIL